MRLKREPQTPEEAKEFLVEYLECRLRLACAAYEAAKTSENMMTLAKVTMALEKAEKVDEAEAWARWRTWRARATGEKPSRRR